MSRKLHDFEVRDLIEPESAPTTPLEANGYAHQRSPLARPPAVSGGLDEPLTPREDAALSILLDDVFSALPQRGDDVMPASTTHMTPAQQAVGTPTSAQAKQKRKQSLLSALERVRRQSELATVQARCIRHRAVGGVPADAGAPNEAATHAVGEAQELREQLSALRALTQSAAQAVAEGM